MNFEDVKTFRSFALQRKNNPKDMPLLDKQIREVRKRIKRIMSGNYIHEAFAEALEPEEVPTYLLEPVLLEVYRHRSCAIHEVVNMGKFNYAGCFISPNIEDLGGFDINSSIVYRVPRTPSDDDDYDELDSVWSDYDYFTQDESGGPYAMLDHEVRSPGSSIFSLPLQDETVCRFITPNVVSETHPDMFTSPDLSNTYYSADSDVIYGTKLYPYSRTEDFV